MSDHHSIDSVSPVTRLQYTSATAWSAAAYRTPKEQFIYHNAGLDGRGGSSYIDTVILRDKNVTVASGAAPSTLRTM